MSDLLHTPRAVFDSSEYAMLHEDKRCRLWLLDMTDGDESGTFARSSRAHLPRKVFGGLPGVSANGGKNVADLKKTGVTRKLASVLPARWYDTPRVSAAAALLGFSLFYADSSALSSFLWGSVQGGVPSKQALAERPDDPETMRFARKMAGYVRHYFLVDKIQYSTSTTA